jgi:hypothetical protein
MSWLTNCYSIPCPCPGDIGFKGKADAAILLRLLLTLFELLSLLQYLYYKKRIFSNPAEAP